MRLHVGNFYSLKSSTYTTRRRLVHLLHKSISVFAVYL